MILLSSQIYLFIGNFVENFDRNRKKRMEKKNWATSIMEAVRIMSKSIAEFNGEIEKFRELITAVAFLLVKKNLSNPFYLEAISLINEILEKGERTNEAILYGFRGGIKRRIKDFKGSIVDLSQALSIEPENVFLLLQRATSYRRLEENDGSIKDLELALKLEPSNPLLIASFGECQKMANNIRGAIVYYDRAMEIEPNHPYILAVRGEANQSIGNYDLSLEDLNKAIALEPDNRFSLSQRGELHRLTKNFKEATKDLDHVLEMFPDDEFALAVRGACRREIGEYNGAIEDLEKSIHADPDDPFTWYHLGQTREILGNFSQAMSHYNSALLVSPTAYYIMGCRGLLHHKMGEDEKAARDLEEAFQSGNYEEKIVWTLVQLKESQGKLKDIFSIFASLRIQRALTNQEYKYSLLVEINRQDLSPFSEHQDELLSLDPKTRDQYLICLINIC